MKWTITTSGEVRRVLKEIENKDLALYEATMYTLKNLTAYTGDSADEWADLRRVALKTILVDFFIVRREQEIYVIRLVWLDREQQSANQGTRLTDCRRAGDD